MLKNAFFYQFFPLKMLKKAFFVEKATNVSTFFLFLHPKRTKKHIA